MTVDRLNQCFTWKDEIKKIKKKKRRREKSKKGGGDKNEGRRDYIVRAQWTRTRLYRKKEGA